MKVNLTKKVMIVVVLVIITLAACQKLLPPAPNPDDDISQGVIPGLTSYQLQEHALGDDEFSQIFTLQQGLGPVFNQASCNNCHTGNGKGAPATSLIRFGKVSNGLFDSLVNESGPNLLPNAIPNYLGEVLPSDANVKVHLIAPVVMGLGFIAALADSSILANSYPHDGVFGVPNYVYPTSFFIPQGINIPNSNGQYIGRFGKKATAVTLQDQVVFALAKDLGGVTCDYNMVKPYNYLVGPYTGNNVQDPDVSAGFVNHLVMYLRTNKVPPRRNTTDPDVIAGQQLFNQIGCSSCHIPTFTTPQSDIAALSNQTFHPYSDFLLHDMGPALDDGVPEGSAQSFQWRTAPLWGLGLASIAQGGGLFLLHDGRATSIEAAVSFHGGEAAGRATNFFALTDAERAQIVKFLMSL